MKKVTQNLLLIGLVFVLASVSPAKKTKKYKSVEGKMSVVFPNEFEIASSKGDAYVTTKISCTEDDNVYFASYSLHSEPLTDPEMLCQTSLDAFTEAIGGEMESQNDWAVKKAKGIKSKMTVPERDAILYYRVVIIGQFQYQFAALGPKSSWDEAAAVAFMNSIKIKK